MRYKVSCSYDGTKFFGWQKQSSDRSVQGELETVISTILNQETPIFGSGRTDAGVHARGQVFHFDCDKELDIDGFRYSMNRMLPSDIHILSIRQVSDDFHARFSATYKHYQYVLNIGEADPFMENYRYEVKRKLNISLMRTALRDLPGKHNFQNLTSKEEDQDGFIREIYNAHLQVKGEVITFDFAGQGFMRYMVRMIVGVLIAIGLEKEPVTYLRDLLTKEPREITHYKAPAQGLYLMGVAYLSDTSLEYCYHTHTKRCGHASGEDEEYVLTAMANGFNTIGFSDHVFLPGVVQTGIRGNYEELDDYVNSIRSLQVKYRNEMTIHLGFEAEYYPEYEDYYRQLLSSKKIDYLILGQHNDLFNGRPRWYFGGIISQDKVRKYKDDAIAGMATGLFKCFVHPDLFMSAYPDFDAFAESITREICEASLKYDVPLEVNLGATRYQGKRQIGREVRYPYPYDAFWKIVSEYGCKVLIGVDAHSPNDFKVTPFHVATNIVNQYHLNYINKLEIE